ncbi:hypothetical protein [Sporosarcina psychrophila]|uniref:hypothetical protein n=1 Tax=Sporosarcina psychrophila TaxID=1476 RepID=UPI00078C5DC8|nr:hypothetical protein [Sporosarcina psychrophila]AMQ06773.1 hypothetical protein AZE41_12975 [Sporosarcina psychrophila]
MTLKARDRVTVLNSDGTPMGEGSIVSVNEWRHPSGKYAIDADFYDKDYLFVGEENLVKIQEVIIND